MWTMKELATNQEQTKIQDDDDGKRKQDVENKMANIGGFSLTVKDEFICTRNDLIAIVGQVGSGKSLFINSILGETYCLNGSIHVQNGVKSLVPQTAWILNRSVRNNILFDHDFNLDIYTKVLVLASPDRLKIQQECFEIFCRKTYVPFPMVPFE